ncbi:MAG: hypothetical protein KDM64_10125, partial [Verrucomicrobiae bacterium]|nr:hypothetical protein [Verrucomicrobiae bacterium]
ERYRNSEAFRDWVQGKAAAALKSDLALGSLRWEGSTAFADGIRARGYQDAGLASLELDGARATLDGVRDGAWQVADAKISRLGIEFSPQRLPGTWAEQNGVVPGADSGHGPAAPAWLKRFLPDQFHLDQIQIDSATLRVLDRASAEAFALRSVKTQLHPEADALEVAGQGGKLALPARPEMTIDRFRVRWQGDKVFINEAEIDLPGKSRVSVNGVATLVEGTDLDLDLKLANFDLADILNPEWKDRVTGRLSGDVTVVGLAKSPETLKQTGTLRLDEGLVKDVPLLQTVAKYTKSKRFERLTLNETRTEFVRQGDRLEFTDLVVQSDGLARLEGTLVIDHGTLDGRFRLGVTPGTLQWIPGAERKVFVQADQGFLWTDLAVSGTVDDPRENLSARLVTAAAETLVEDAPQKAIDAAKDALKDPAATPDTVIEQGKKALESLLPLFK